MFNLVQKRFWYFLFSGLIIGSGIVLMTYSIVATGAPFRLSVEFVGGSIYDISFVGSNPNESDIRDVFAQYGDENVIIQRLGQPQYKWAIRDVAIENPNNVEGVVQAVTDIFEASALGGTLSVELAEDSTEYLLTFSAPIVDEAEIRNTFADVLDEDSSIRNLITTRWSIRGSFQDSEIIAERENQLEEQIAPIDRDTLRFEAVSPTIGAEVARAALFAVVVGSLVVTGFILLAFRNVPNRFRYGVCAIMAMVHDVLVVMGVMSLMGLLLGWEVDALFLTAVLTVVGFSVQDTIVIFDRIRENLPLHLGEPYETIVNRSLWETIHRSLATQLNAFFIMIAILLFGGETVRQFIFILFIGLLSGSYSSLFTAVPLLVSWEKGEIPFLNQDSKLKSSEA